MALGNPEIAHHHRRERFVARVCAPEELGLLEANPKQALWTLFAAKEAAYKVLVKLGHEPGFAHRAIIVSPDLQSVRWKTVTMTLAADVNEHRVHAVAWIGGGAIVSGDAAATTDDLGLEVRSFACASLAQRLGCTPEELSVLREPRPQAWDGFGPPRLLLGGAPAPLDLSLSHDAGFVAFAAI